MVLYARSGADKEDFQLLTDHLRGVAETAEAFASEFGAGAWARTAGILHDRGKASREFQKRLRDNSLRVDHSTAGAQLAAKKWPGAAGRILAACIAGHHGGLSDGMSGERSSLASRLERTGLPEIIRSDELPEIGAIGKLPFKPNAARLGFQTAFFIRMLFSCLVDADGLDAEKFSDRDKALIRQGHPDLKTIEARFFEKMESVIRNADSKPINSWRKDIYDACLASAGKSQGIFSLTVPTGGGKTLSSLAFALKHAATYGLKRIIYVIPFTSIIEQNAAVFREFTGGDSVLEHHSAFDPARFSTKSPEGDEELKWFELAAENWDAPLIVTTNVQFFESLFSSRRSQCRKLHNIAGSVVILDEAQMLPVEHLLPCIEALRELSENYRATIVLCTATQPALTKNNEFKQGLDTVHEIIPDPKGLYEKFRRVECYSPGRFTTESLLERLRRNERALCVVNTRREALEVFEGIKDLDGAFHLSACMCPEHRSLKLAEIKSRLKDKAPCLAVSTTLIEAGVDIDFPVVYRALSGVDSVAQAAGRCNREGLLAPGRGDLFLFEFEGGKIPGFLRRRVEVAAETLRKYTGDPLELEAVEFFFRSLYWREGDRLDNKEILKDLKEGARECFFPFRTVDGNFRIIDQEHETVIIPFDEKALGVLSDLRRTGLSRTLLRKTQRYTVQIWPSGTWIGLRMRVQ